MVLDASPRKLIQKLTLNFSPVILDAKKQENDINWLMTEKDCNKRILSPDSGEEYIYRYIKDSESTSPTEPD